MSDDDWYDPRMENTVEPKEGDVYGDTRHEDADGEFDEQYRIVYVDDEVVLLRSDSYRETGSGYRGKHYRLERRDGFEKQAGSGRYKPVSSASTAPEHSQDIHYHIGAVKRLLAHYSEKPGRTAAHKAEALREAVETLETYDAEEQDWTEVDTIGQTAADNLKSEGFVTDADVEAATIEQLVDVDYVGESGAENLKAYVGDKT